MPAEVAAVAMGVVATVGFGVLVDPIVEKAGAAILPFEAPTEAAREAWEKLSNQAAGGAWIGFFERLIFFASLWIPDAWPILSSWLVFKLAIYWQSSNFAELPKEPPGKDAANYIVSKWQLGSHHACNVLVGTSANIVCALIGVGAGRWILL